jgi:predicted transcriptional regulator
MSKTVLSVRVSDDLKDQLDFLAKATRRSKAFLAEEAIAEYIERNAWKAKCQ